MDIKQKVMNEISYREYELLGQYYHRYPMNWVKTIEKCLADENNSYEFRYNAKGELQRIRIITNYGDFGSEWNYYIVFKD